MTDDTYAWDRDDDTDRNDEMSADAAADTCPMCDGPLVPLGMLGRRLHSRCRCCGMGVSREPAADVDTDTDSPF